MTTPANPYALLPVADQRALLNAERQIILRDRFTHELDVKRLGLSDLAGRLAHFDDALAYVAQRLGALPPA